MSDCRLATLRLGVNARVSICAAVCAFYFYAGSTFALWDFSQGKTKLHTSAWHISGKTHKGKRQIKIQGMIAYMVCYAARLTASEDIAFYSSFILAQV